MTEQCAAFVQFSLLLPLLFSARLLCTWLTFELCPILNITHSSNSHRVPRTVRCICWSFVRRTNVQLHLESETKTICNIPSFFFCFQFACCDNNDEYKWVRKREVMREEWALEEVKNSFPNFSHWSNTHFSNSPDTEMFFYFLWHCTHAYTSSRVDTCIGCICSTACPQLNQFRIQSDRKKKFLLALCHVERAITDESSLLLRTKTVPFDYQQFSSIQYWLADCSERSVCVD